MGGTRGGWDMPKKICVPDLTRTSCGDPDAVVGSWILLGGITEHEGDDAFIGAAATLRLCRKREGHRGPTQHSWIKKVGSCSRALQSTVVVLACTLLVDISIVHF